MTIDLYRINYDQCQRSLLQVLLSAVYVIRLSKTPLWNESLSKKSGNDCVLQLKGHGHDVGPKFFFRF